MYLSDFLFGLGWFSLVSLPIRIRIPWGQGLGLSYSSVYHQHVAWSLELSGLPSNTYYMNEWMNLWLPWCRLSSFIRLQFASASPLCFLPWPANNLLPHTVFCFTTHPCWLRPSSPDLSPPATQWTMCLSWSCFSCCLSDQLELLTSAALCCLYLSQKQPKPQLPWDPTANLENWL